MAGIAIMVGSAGSAVLDGPWVLMLIGSLGMVYGISGVHRHQAPADGWPGRWGALLVRFGAAVMVLPGIVVLVWEAVGDPPEQDPVVIDVAWTIGFAAFVVGVITFAIGTIRAKVLPVGSGVLMLVGLVAAIAVDMITGAFFGEDPGTTEWGFFIGVPVFGLGLAWAGHAVWTGSRTRSEPADVSHTSA